MAQKKTDSPSRKRKKLAADLFCGAGGMSQGLLEACQQQGYPLHLVAVNHWPIAIDTHSANHPYAKHLCANLDSVDPKKLVPGGRLDVLLAGIECTHHSNARGGKPRNDQSRSSAWLLLKWASELYIDTIIIENVREFMSWGPLGADMQPLKSKRGETFLAFIANLKSLAYRYVEYRVIRCCDYGDATTRERLFIIARKNKPIVWPEPTHAPKITIAIPADSKLFPDLRAPWRTAREIIDWQQKGESIFTRKRPLAQKTIDRIAAGLRKFGGSNAEPFLVMLYGTNKVRSVDKPVPTVTANGNHIGLAEPFLVNLKGKSDACPIDGPVPTVTTIPHVGVVEPNIIGPKEAWCGDHLGQPAIEPFVIGQQSGAHPRSVEEPVPTVCTAGKIALIEPQSFLLSRDHYGANGGQVRSVEEPIPTVTGSPAIGLVEPTAFIVEVNHAENGGGIRSAKSLDDPLSTITQKRGHGLVDPFVTKYYSTGIAKSVDEPLDTLTTHARYGLVTTEQGTFKLDIRFRMLTNRELARAQGFPDDYEFRGKKTEVTKQIGNAVPKNTARALCAQVLA